MKNQNYHILIVVMFALVGCATLVAPKLNTINTPNVKTEQTAEVGNAIIKHALTYTKPGIYIDEDVTIENKQKKFTLNAGSLIARSTEKNKKQTYIIPTGRITLFDKQSQTTESLGEYILVLDDNKAKIISFQGRSKKIPSPAQLPNLTRLENIAVGPTQFEQQLVYTGKTGNVIYLKYREYKNNMARDAFTQDVQFDISSEKLIGFKGARIEVLNASNTQIEYRVLKGFTGKFSQ